MPSRPIHHTDPSVRQTDIGEPVPTLITPPDMRRNGKNEMPGVVSNPLDPASYQTSKPFSPIVQTCPRCAMTRRTAFGMASENTKSNASKLSGSSSREMNHCDVSPSELNAKYPST